MERPAIDRIVRGRRARSPRRWRMSGSSVVSAACRTCSIRPRMVANERADSGRPCFSRSASASSAPWASRAPVSARGEVARLVPQVPGLVAEERLDQPQQRPPALHRPAEVVHRLGLGLSPGPRWRPRGGEDVAGGRPQRLPHRHARPQGGLLAHVEQYTTIFRIRPIGVTKLTKPAAGLFKPCHGCYICARRGDVVPRLAFSDPLTRGGAAR